MYQLGYKVAARFIVNIAESQKKIAKLRRSEREEKAHNAIVYMIARYLRVKDFAITKSFTAYLYLRIKHELFYQRKVDTIVDFVDWENYRGANIENTLLDQIEKLNDDSLADDLDMARMGTTESARLLHITAGKV
jgi:hypothetical protein